jgi:hypothetical protein
MADSIVAATAWIACESRRFFLNGQSTNKFLRKAQKSGATRTCSAALYCQGNLLLHGHGDIVQVHIGQVSVAISMVVEVDADSLALV